MMLRAVAKYRPKFLVGYEQGGVVLALAAMPLVMEAACRARIVTPDEMKQYRLAWANVSALIIVNPLIMPQSTKLSELRSAVPELVLTQPRGVHRQVVTRKPYLHREFAEQLALLIGAVASQQVDRAPLIVAAGHRPPLYFEEDASGIGACVGCGKKQACG